MTLAAGFWTDFTEQDNEELLKLGLVAGALYGAVVLVVPLLARETRWFRSVVWGVLAVQIFVVALVFFEAAALYYRPEPESEEQPLGEAFEEWQLTWQIGFFALYAAALGLSAGVGYLLEKRRGALQAAGVLLGFMLVTAGFVGYMNECEVGFGRLGDFPCT